MLIEIDKIEEKLDSLPERLKEMVLDDHVNKTVVEIAINYGLNTEKKDVLMGETTLLLIGAITGEDFIKDLKSLAQIDHNLEAFHQ